MKKTLSIIALGLLALGTTPTITLATTSVKVKAVEQDPNKFINQVGEDLFKELNKQKKEINKDPNVLKKIVKDKLIPHLNARYAASMVLGNHYKNLSESQRKEFFEAFENYLITQYAQIFTMYDGQEIKYIPTSYDGKIMHKTNVQVIEKGKLPVNLQFSLRKNSKSNIWQVYDVVAEGISMVQSKRQEWTKPLREGKFDSIVQELNKFAKANISKSK